MPSQVLHCSCKTGAWIRKRLNDPIWPSSRPESVRVHSFYENAAENVLPHHQDGPIRPWLRTLLQRGRQYRRFRPANTSRGSVRHAERCLTIDKRARTCFVSAHGSKGQCGASMCTRHEKMRQFFTEDLRSASFEKVDCVLVSHFEGEDARIDCEGGSPGRASMEFPTGPSWKRVTAASVATTLSDIPFARDSSTLVTMDTSEGRRKRARNPTARNPSGTCDRSPSRPTFQTCEPK